MHVAVVDLGYGDAGKGTITDWLCRQMDTTTVVRFNGGAQAAHNVITKEGTHHTFSQFSSGTFAGAKTFLSRFMVVDLFALASEAALLKNKGIDNPFALLEVEQGALLSTPYHRAANQAKETLRGAAKHGSCGMGIGETMEYSLTNIPLKIEDCYDKYTLIRKLDELRTYFEALYGPLDAPNVKDVAELYTDIAGSLQLVDSSRLGEHLRNTNVVFEGAQGVLLDEWYGFHPHTTWSTTTFENALTLAKENGVQITKLGVTRAYSTRHGAGPFVAEDKTLTAAIPEKHNGTGIWQGEFRKGHLDLVGLRYALEVTKGIDLLAVTCLDEAEKSTSLQKCVAYETPTGTLANIPPQEKENLIQREKLTNLLKVSNPGLEDIKGSFASELHRLAPIAVESWGPSSTDKQKNFSFI